MTTTGNRCPRRRAVTAWFGFGLVLGFASLGVPSGLAGQRSTTEAGVPAGPIVGLVVDGDSRRGIEGVLVSLGDHSVVTNERGRFILGDLHAGPGELVSEILGYETRQDSILLPEYQSTEVVHPFGPRSG